MAFKKR